MNEKSGPPEDERGDFSTLLSLLEQLIVGIRDHNIAKFLEFFLLDSPTTRTKFFTAPGARGENPGHHSFNGGLAYHTLHAAKLAGKIADHYNGLGIPVNRDIVVAGTILHDIGKIDCYEWKDGPRKEFYHGEEVEVEAGYTHTTISKMFHHIPHGFQLFMRRAYDFCDRHERNPDIFKHTLTEK